MEYFALCLVEEGFHVFISGMNRGITVAIALYRYCLIFYPLSYVDSRRLKDLERNMMKLILGRVMIYFIEEVF